MESPTNFLLGLDRAGQDCVDYLIRHIRRDGSFDYSINARTGKPSADYNILRHGGTIYAIAQWMDLHRPRAGQGTGQGSVQGAGQNPPYKDHDIMERPVSYLLAQAHPLEKAASLYCIVEGNTVKLGGTALALLALTEGYKTHPRRQDKVWMGRFAEFILWMQQPNGKFYSKFHYRERQFAAFESTYYPGEAILSLTRLYRLDPDPRWLQAAVSAAEYLLEHPVLDKKGARAHNHWLVIALADLFQILPRPEFYEEAWRITDAAMDALDQKMAQHASSASIATYGEMAVALILLEQKRDRSERDHPEQDRSNLNSPAQARIDKLLASVQDILRYCLNLQVREKEHFDPGARGGIRKDSTDDTIQIDFVQHVLQVISGLLSVRSAG